MSDDRGEQPEQPQRPEQPKKKPGTPEQPGGMEQADVANGEEPTVPETRPDAEL